MAPSQAINMDVSTTPLAGDWPLPVVSACTGMAYRRAKPELVHWMISAMAADHRIDELIGGHSTATVAGNLRHHADFMDAVFRINRFDLLVRVLPWVYRTNISRGFQPDYFTVALERWKTAASRYLDGDAALEIVTVYEWMLEHHDPLLARATRPPQRAELMPASWQEPAKAFYAALIGNRVDDAMRLARSAVGSPGDLQDFGRFVVQPSLYRLGDQWESGAVSVAEEHMGTAIAARVMAAFYPMIFSTPKTRGTAVVSTAANEFHEMGGRMVADALTLSGWETHFLGANVPIDSVLNLLEARRVDLLALSVMMPFNLSSLLDLIEGMRARPALNRVRVMVGGWMFSVISDLWASVSADGSAADGPSAARLAARWWEVRP